MPQPGIELTSVQLHLFERPLLRMPYRLSCCVPGNYHYYLAKPCHNPAAVTLFQIGIELLICAVHPIPGRYYVLWTTKLSNHGGKIGSQWVPVDVTLSLPMFFRLYLICR